MGNRDVDGSGWFFHYQPGYLGNEGNEEEMIYSRYILTFHRREAVDAYQPVDVEQAEDSDREEINQRNAAEDAIGSSKH